MKTIPYSEILDFLGVDQALSTLLVVHPCDIADLACRYAEAAQEICASPRVERLLKVVRDVIRLALQEPNLTVVVAEKHEANLTAAIFEFDTRFDAVMEGAAMCAAQATRAALIGDRFGARMWTVRAAWGAAEVAPMIRHKVFAEWAAAPSLAP